MWRAYLTIIFHGLRYRKLRSSLTVTGIFIGILVVVALVFLGQGLRRAVSTQLRQFGSDLLFVLPRDVSDPVAALVDRGEFRDRDAEAVRDAPGVSKVMPMIFGVTASAEFKGEKKTIALRGSPWDFIKEIFEESQGLHLAAGDWPVGDDTPEIVLGSEFASKTFSRPVQVNDRIVIRGRAYTVKAVLSAIGEQQRDNSVFMSLKTIRRVTGRHDGLSALIVKVEPGADVDVVSEAVNDVLNLQKDLDEFTVMTPAKAAVTVGNIISLIETVLAMVAVVAVVIGGIGVMNSMYTSVMERTREIGIMKSIGATNAHVISLFLLEAGVFGLVGGASGVIGGVALAKIVEIVAAGYGYDFLAIAIDPVVVAETLFFTFLVGVISGVLPALEAARLNPASAVRQR